MEKYYYKMRDGKKLSRLLLNAPADKEVDHKNGDITDNSPENLRLVTRQQNCHNKGAIKGKDLPKGVYKARYQFVAAIKHNGFKKHLGTFSTVEAAERAYQDAADIIQGEYAYHNSRNRSD